MKLKLCRHLWGIDETWEQSFPRIREAGYEVIEAGLPAKEDADCLRRLLAEYDFGFVPQAKTRGDEVSTLTPEFGPPTYLHTIPHSDKPVADLWEICNWQAERQSVNFAAWAESAPVGASHN